MKPTKVGQIVKFEKPLDEYEIHERFIIREIFFDVERPRTIVEYIDNHKLKSTHSYLVEDLEVVC